MRLPVPDLRIRTLADHDPDGDGEFVLYWMIGQRRLHWNFALDRAVSWALELDRPLVVLEALRIGYPWASARHHRFVLDGMGDHRAALASGLVRYLAYVEPEAGAGKGLLEALASRAAVVVTDDMPHFFYPAMLEAAAGQVPVRFEAVDSHGLLPIREADRDFTVAHSFRRYLHKTLPEHLPERPAEDPVAAAPGLKSASSLQLDGILERWPEAPDDWLERGAAMDDLPLGGGVAPVAFPGGRRAALERLDRFFADRLPRYGEDRNDPDHEAASRLSPYLHWGHVSTHEIFHALVQREDWTPNRLAPEPTGKREGWWGMSRPAEAFLDELVTWRELGWTAWARGGPELETLEVLPDWARETLADHADDEREHLYDLAAFDAAETHDALWNAAQRELVREGTIHNYLRMLWGKKILEWTRSPQEALDVMFELNNRYAVDGRDPNSTSGIMWVLGRYDRAWTERPVFGKVRYMTSENTRRKVSLDAYLRRHAE
ncbi:MAG TPA: deoxyribodipyrimidine photo-lyase [Longimicrobiales bacterium]|nr:deoxyribodipyrimidine photo-lyase [Longimicrobiales bacterium]